MMPTYVPSSQVSKINQRIVDCSFLHMNATYFCIHGRAFRAFNPIVQCIFDCYAPNHAHSSLSRSWMDSERTRPSRLLSRCHLNSQAQTTALWPLTGRKSSGDMCGLETTRCSPCCLARHIWAMWQFRPQMCRDVRTWGNCANVGWSGPTVALKHDFRAETTPVFCLVSRRDKEHTGESSQTVLWPLKQIEVEKK